MKRAILSPRAEDDLVDIARFLAHHSRQAARIVIWRLRRRCQWLATAPHAGRPRDELLPGLRSVAVSGYVVFYVPTRAGVAIYRVIHASRDVDAIFGDEPG